MNYDPNATGQSDQGIFGFPFSREQSQLVLLPVPWDVTTSYGKGTAQGPEAILQSSRQLDVGDDIFGDFYEQGIFMEEIPMEWQSLNDQFADEARSIQDKLESGQSLGQEDQATLENINSTCQALNNWVKNQSLSILDEGKIPGLIGGDHSCPLGLISALKEKYSDLSILHVDAHMDLRKSYQGFDYSHASIMRNVCDQIELQALIQLGIRDFCPEERDYSRMAENIYTHFDGQTQLRLHKGQNWFDICNEMVEPLSENVYISFDIDGLNPDLCPNTGTPVPGGLSFSQVGTLLYALKNSQRKVVGFDLCEVSPGSNLDGWDGNVGARILYKLCGAALS